MGGDEGWKREAFGEHSIIGGDQFVNKTADRRRQTAEWTADRRRWNGRWTVDRGRWEDRLSSLSGRQTVNEWGNE